MYLDALTERVPWFVALDHTNYVRYIPVHLRDITELPTKHPYVAREFNAGNFTIEKTNRVFSAIAIDQAHDNVMEELGNPFEEKSEDLLVLDSKEIADPSAVEAVKKAQKIGQQQFQTFTKECLVERTKPIGDTIHRNRLKLFVGSRTKTASKEKQQLTLMKSDVELFSRLYLSNERWQSGRLLSAREPSTATSALRWRKITTWYQE